MQLSACTRACPVIARTRQSRACSRTNGCTSSRCCGATTSSQGWCYWRTGSDATTRRKCAASSLRWECSWSSITPVRRALQCSVCWLRVVSLCAGFHRSGLSIRTSPLDNSWFAIVRHSYNKSMHAVNIRRRDMGTEGDVSDEEQAAIMLRSMRECLPRLPAYYRRCGIDGSLAVPGQNLRPTVVPSLKLPFTEPDKAALLDSSLATDLILPTVQSAVDSKLLFVVRAVAELNQQPQPNVGCLAWAFQRSCNPATCSKTPRDASGLPLTDCDLRSEKQRVNSFLRRAIEAAGILDLYDASHAVVLQLFCDMTRSSVTVHRLEEAKSGKKTVRVHESYKYSVVASRKLELNLQGTPGRYDMSLDLGVAQHGASASPGATSTPPSVLQRRRHSVSSVRELQRMAAAFSFEGAVCSISCRSGLNELCIRRRAGVRIPLAADTVC